MTSLIDSLKSIAVYPHLMKFLIWIKLFIIIQDPGTISDLCIQQIEQFLQEYFPLLLLVHV